MKKYSDYDVHKSYEILDHPENPNKICTKRFSKYGKVFLTFKIIWDKKAQNELMKLEVLIARRIVLKVKELSEDPFSKDIKRLQGEKSFRLRVGDYRVIFDIVRDTIIVLSLGHRKNIYET